MTAVAVDYKQLANAIIANSASVIDPTTYNPEVAAELEAAAMLEANGRTLKIGPFEVRPAPNYEVPIGRDYQPIDVPSVSRLAGFLGRDEWSLFIREVPYDPSRGWRPSRTGIWIRFSEYEPFRRLEPGEAVRINKETEIRIGGNGVSGDSGFQVFVI